MIAILLALTFFAQGATGLTSDNGTIAGTLKTSSGTPAVGVRVTAMSVPNSTVDAVSSFSMVSLSETGIDGRYRLENIPPGRYYVTAGSVDNPTYFPGSVNLTGGTIVSVAAKANLSGMDFVMQDSSIRVASLDGARPALSVPVSVVVENGGKQPVSANGKFVTLGLTRTADGTRSDVRLDGASIVAPIPSPVAGAEYRITLDNLPDGYALKSMTYGSTNLVTDTLQLNPSNFLQLTAPGTASTSNGTGTPPLTGVSVLSILGGAYTGTVTLSGWNGFGQAASTLKVTLTAPPATPSQPGQRITGSTPFQGGSWSIYRGDVPGIFYADGSFELRGVPSGRHVVVLQNVGAAPQYYAALVDIADRDVDGVKLDNVGVLPGTVVALPATESATVGSFRSPGGLIGHAVEEDGKTPIAHGAITILGQSMSTIPIGNEGQFIIPHMLPGSYDLRIESFEHFTLYETVVVTDQDIRKDFIVRSAKADPPTDSPADPTTGTPTETPAER